MVTNVGALPRDSDQNPLEHKMVPMRVPFEGSYWELGLAAVWFFSTATVLPGMGGIRYLCLLGFIIGAVLNRDYLRPYLGHLWFFFLFPAWVLFSTLWSPNTGTAMKFGMMHFLDVMLLIYIAIRLSPQQIIRAIYYGYIPVALIVIAFIPNLGSHSVPMGFIEKNSVATRMLFMFMASLYMLYEARSFLWEKASALLFIPLCLLSIFLVESATSLALAILAFLVMTFIGTVWKTLTRVQAGTTLLMLTGGLMAMSVLLIAISIFIDGPVNAFLDMMGKDATLTGRTELWEFASKDLIPKHPFMGLGAEGFWQIGRGDAEGWLEYFYKEQGVRFSFHNSYIEMIVHLGYVGLITFLIPLAFSVWRAISNFFRYQDIASAFFLIVAVLALARSMTESELYNVFDISKAMLFIGGITMLSSKTVLVPMPQNVMGRVRS